MLFGQELSNKYLRGRIEAINHLYMIEKEDKGKRYLRMGTDLYKTDQLEALTEKFADHYDDSALSFTEICSFNTWFKLHPEKVAGEEKLTTSLHFPVTIKGNSQDVEKLFKAKSAENPSIEQMELEAYAELELLKLLKL
jgi:hypothetical protein